MPPAAPGAASAAERAGDALEVSITDVEDAARRLQGRIVRTPLLRVERLEPRLGRRVWMKCENLQRGGSFKLRGATNAIRALPADRAARGVAAHSSGNHAVAVALAARDRGVPATLVVPEDAPLAKTSLVEAAGARLVRCAPTLAARVQTLAGIVAETGAVEIHPYDDPLVIAGAGTAALEICADLAEPPGCVVVPVGGGGLASGTAVTLAARSPGTRLWGAEPAAVDDAARSLASGRLVGHDGTSIADGLLTTLSPRTFEILSRHLDRVVTVGEDEILAAMRLAAEAAGLVIEPSAAVALAAVRAAGGDLPPGDVVILLTGRNVAHGLLRRALGRRRRDRVSEGGLEPPPPCGD